MTRADFDKAIGLVFSGSQAHQVCNEYIKSLEAELEALQHRSCEGCKYGEYHDETATYCKEYVREKTFNLANPNDFYCKHFKPKEQ